MDPTARAVALKVHNILLEVFGYPIWQETVPAIDELICTILSQNTNDRNRDLAYHSLRKKYPAWEEVRDATTEEVISCIRSAGLANQKGRRIKEVLQQISTERGTLDLTFLKEYSRDEATAWLTRFKGVGPKTAAIVLLFSLGIPAFPVDTHIFRVSGRIGLRPLSMSVEDAHKHLAELLPPEEYGPAHLNLIRLGREICHARKPDCRQCPVSDLCEYYRTNDKG